MNGHGSLNRIFRIVWNVALGQWQVASEHARGRGKTKAQRSGLRGLAALAAGSILMLCSTGALAELPTGGQITAGNGQIGTPTNGHLVINQNSNKMVIDWTSYSIGSGNSVQYIQPSANAIALNRVLGGDPSVIRGTISANGRVVLLNPNGIMFGPTSNVEVASLLASTLNITNEDFMSGNFRLEGDSLNAVVNQGSIKAADGGFVALIAAKIENVGDISVRGGEVLMGSGRKVRLDLGGPAKIEVDEAVVEGYIRNGGLIKAEGGTVMMTVKAAGELASFAINNEGMIEATSLARGDGGTIRLLADGGTVANSGSLNVSSADGKGGHIEVTGDVVGILDGSVVDASGATGGGTVLLGGDYQGKNAQVTNAKRTFVGADASIRANATQSGDGGKVIVWSDDRTAFSGTIEAKGGAESGNGGFVEVSGKQFLDFQGAVDTSAANGRNGTLLLDPTNLTIGNVGTSGWITNENNTFGDFTNDTDPNPAHDFSFLRVDVLLAALANNDITVHSACDISACAGNITVIDAITWNSGRALTLDATGSVTINAAITSIGADGVKGGDFNVIAGTTQHNGDIYVNANITTTGGAASGAGLVGGNVNLTTGNGAVVFDNGAVISTGGSAAAAGSDAAGGAAGAITLNSTAGIRLNNGQLLAQGGAADGSGATGAGGRVSLISTNNDITQNGGSRIVGRELLVQAGAGSIYLDNGSNQVEAFAASSDSGDIYFRNVGTAGLTVTDIEGTSGVSTGGAGAIQLSARNLLINSRVSSQNGSITLDGDQGLQPGDFSGVVINGTDVTTANGHIRIYGRGGDAAGGGQSGVVLASGATVSAGDSGSLEVVAAGGSGETGENHGLVVDGGSFITDGGDIDVRATGGSGGDDNNAIVFRNFARIGREDGDQAVSITTLAGSGDNSTAFATDAAGGAITAGSRDLTLQGNTQDVSGDAQISLNTTGTLAVKAASSFESPFKLSEFTEGFNVNNGGTTSSGFSELAALVIGQSGNTADIQIDQSLALDMDSGSITLIGGDIDLNDAIAASNLTATAAGNINQSETGGSFTLGSANLRSTGGDITLEGASNAVGALAATATGAITFDNGGNHLDLNGNLSGASVHLHAGSIHQNWGSITTEALEIATSNGGANLGQSNNVDTLAADINGGDLTFNNAGQNTGKLTIGTVGDTTGVSGTGSVTLNNIRDLEITGNVSAGTGVTVTTSRNIDLGTEDAAKLSLTDAEIDRISAQSLTLTTSGSVLNSDDVRAGALSAMTIIAGQGIVRSGTGQLGFSHIDNGALTLTSNSSADGQGIGTSSSNRLITVGASELTLTSWRDIHVDARARFGGSGSANLDKLHIDSKSAAASNSSFSVLSTATLSLAGNGSVPNWYQAVPKGTYNISLTNADALDFKFVGNAPISVTGATSVGAGDFMLETAYGINVGSNISSSSGNITLKAGGALGNYVGINLNGTSIVTADGVITLDGKGGTGRNTDEYSTRSNQIGVQIAGGGSVRATGTGSIDITGRGGSTGSNWQNAQYGGNSDGVVITGTNSRVEAAGGNIAISGTGGTSSSEASATSDGIVLESGGAITNASGSVKLSGVSGSGINNIPARSITQSGAGIITAAGLEVITGNGAAYLQNNNNVGTLAGDVRSGFYFDNGGNNLIIGTVNGRAGFSDTSTFEIGLYDINALTVNESIEMASGTLKIAANTVSIADGKRIGDRVSNGANRNVKVWMTGRSDGATADRNIDVGSNNGAALGFTSTLLDKIYANELELATAGAITVTADTDFKNINALTLTSTGATSNAGANRLILSGANNDGTLTLNGTASAGSSTHAMQVGGANKVNVSSGGQFNVIAYTDDVGSDTLIDLKSVSIDSRSGGADLSYQIVGGGLSYAAAGTGSGYRVSANATGDGPVNFSFQGNAGISINGDSDLKGGALTLRATSGSITALNNVAIKSGNASFRAAGNITFSPGTSLNTAGTLSIRSDGAGGNFTTGTGSRIASTGKIDIRADNVTLNAGTTLTTPGTVEVNQTTGDRTIQLGGASEGTGLSLTAAELGMISADTLIIGRNVSNDPTSGAITITGATNLTNISNLILRSRAGSVSQSGGATLGVENLEISLNSGNITLNEAGNQIAGFTANTTGSVSLANTGYLNIKGITSNGGAISVTSSGNMETSGLINATASGNGVNANGGTISLTSSGATLRVRGNISSNGYSSSGNAARQGGAITLSGGIVELGAVSINSTGSSNSTANGTGGNAGSLVVDATVPGSTILLDGTTINLTGGYGQSAYGTGSSLTFNDAVVLTSLTGSAPKTATINAGGGNVTFNNTVNGRDGIAGNLTIGSVRYGTTPSYGSVSFGGAIGATEAMGNLSLNNVQNATLASVRAAGVAITNTTGTTTLNGNLNTNGLSGININSNAIAPAGGVEYITTNLGNIKLATKGGLTLADTSAFNSSGNIDLTADGGITLSGGTMQTEGAGIIFRSDTTVQNNLAIDTTGGGAAVTGGNVEFHGKLDSSGGERDLTITAGTHGDVVFSGQVGNTGKMGAVTVNSARNVTTSSIFKAASFAQVAGTGTTTFGGATTLDDALNFTGNALTINQALTAAKATVTNSGLFTTGAAANITTNGGFDQIGTGGNLLAGSITTDDTNISFAGATRTNGNLSLNTGSTASGDVVFGSTLDSALATDNSTLSINTGGGEIVFDGAVGEDKALGNVTLTSGQNLDLDAFSTRSLTRNGAGSTTLVDGAEINTTNGQTYNSAVVLGGNATLNGGSGAITFSNTVDGAGSLAVNTSGTTTFDAAVGGTTALASLTTDAGGTTVFSGGAVTTTGSQTYADNVELGADTTFASTGGNAITFGRTVNSASSGNYGLTVNTMGTTSFNGVVGGNRALSTIAVAAQQGTLLLNGGLFHSMGAQTYNSGTIILGGDTTLQSTGAGAITLNGNVDAAICTVASLEVLTQGMTVFGGAIGTYRPLWSVYTDGPASTPGNTVVFANGTVVTLGDQTYGELAVLDTNTSLKSLGQGTITFNGPVRAAQDGVQSLTVDTSGDIVFNGQVGDNDQRLASLDTGESIDGTVWINGGGVNTAGTQVYRQQVALGNDAILTGTTGTFDVGVDGHGRDLTLRFSGPTELEGEKFTGVRNLTSDGEGVTNVTGTIATTGTQTYTSDVVLGSDVVLQSTGIGAAGDITLGKVDGAHGLTINTAGTTSLAGTVGGDTALTSLTTDGPGLTTISGGSVTTTGAQTYSDAVQITANATLSSEEDADIVFAGTVNGVGGLTVNTSGVTRFDGNVGGTTALASLTTDAGGSVEINGGGVTTIGAQTYGDAVTLGTNATLNSYDGGNIRFNGTVDGAYALRVNTDGATVFEGEVGGNTALASLTTDAGGTSAINGGSVTTIGAQTYGDAVTLGTNATLTSYDGGNIRFNGTVDGAHALTVNTDGATVFEGEVGGNTALTSLTTDAGGSVVISGGGVTTTGRQTYGDALTLGADAVLESTDDGDIVFNGTVDGLHDLTVITGGTTRFNEAVGDTSELLSLTTGGTGTVVLNGGSVKTQVDQTYGNAVRLAADTVLASSQQGDITFNGTVNGAHDLMVETGGASVFNGGVGNVTALRSLTTDADGEAVINGGLIRTTGAQTFNDGVTVGANTVFSSNGPITFVSTLDGPWDVTVRTPGVTTFGGAIGSTAPLANLNGGSGRGKIDLQGPSITLTGTLTFEEPVHVHNPVVVNVGGDALFYGDAKTGKSLLDVTAGGRIQFGRPGNLDNLKSYLPTLFSLGNQHAQSNGTLPPTLFAQLNNAGSQQPSVGDLNLVNVTSPAGAGVGSSNQSSESLLNLAVAQIAADENSRLMTYIVSLDGGLRMEEESAEESTEQAQ